MAILSLLCSAINSAQFKNFGYLFRFLNGSPGWLLLSRSCAKTPLIWFSVRSTRTRQPRGWRNSQTGRKVTIPHHTGDMAEGTLRAILRQAEINVALFLKA